MTKFKFIYICLGIIFFTSCEDAFQQVIEIDIPKHESKLVTYCLLDDIQDTFHVDVYNSISILESDYAKIKDAKIKLAIDNNPVITPFVFDSAFYVDYYSGHWDSEKMMWVNDTIGGGAYVSEKFDLNKEKIVMNVSVSGFPETSASAIVPPKPEILSTEYKSKLDTNGFTVGTIIAEFDNIQPGYHYLVSAVNEDEGQQRYSLDLMPKDPNFTSKYLYSMTGLPSQFLLFDGNEFERHFKARFGFDSQVEGDEQHYQIQIRAISEDVLNFVDAIVIYEDAIDNPFAEPVVIPSNFEDGYGVFGVIRTASKRFK